MTKQIELKAKFRKPKKAKYDDKSLAEGVKIESEHSSDRRVQRLIAKNHLDEDANYYRKLKKMEKRKK